MKRRGRARRAEAGAAACIFLAGALAGCLGGDVVFEPDAFAEVVEGTGYSSVDLVTTDNGEIPVAAAFGAGGRTVAVLFSGGNLSLWSDNGTAVDHLRITDAVVLPGLNGLEFLPNGSLLVYDKDRVAAYSAGGVLEWRWTAGPGPTVHAVRAIDNGSLLLIGYDNASAEVVNLLTGEVSPVAVASGQVTWSVGASSSGSIVATSASSAIFTNPGGHLKATVNRVGSVAVSADGSRGVVGPGSEYSPGWMTFVDLSVEPASVVELPEWENDSLFADRSTVPPKAYISASGRFAAAPVALSTEGCHSASCRHMPNVFVRVVDLEEPQRDLGFRSMEPSALHIGDDGSALAVAFDVVGYQQFRVVLTTAAAGARPPHLQPAPTPPPVA
jgi:hypothetical protein